MSRRGRPTNNMTKGVLDDLLAARVDLEIYDQALKRGTNAVILPQGGATRRPGLRHVGFLRNQLRRVPLTAGMITAPAGGTVANLLDQTLASECRTSGGPSGATWVFLTIDLGASTKIECVDLVRFSSGSAAADSCIGVETSPDNTVWTAFGRALNIRTTTNPRTRRFALAPGTERQARYIRAVIYGAPAIGTVGVGEVAVFKPTVQPSNVRKLNFSFDRTQTYAMFATDRCIDVFRNGVWQAAIPIPHRSEQLADITRAQSSDLMLLFNGDVQPWAVFREGAHWEWNSYAQTYANVPALASGTIFAVAQDEIQRVTINAIAASDTFTVETEGTETAPITRGSDATVLAAAIAAAIEALPNVLIGLVVTVSELTTSKLVFDVKFSGSAGGRVWPPMFIDVLTNDVATYTVETIQDGRPASGSLMSAQTGWPRCGTFFQARGIYAGFKLQPETIIGSQVASYFDFNTSSGLGADAAIEYALDSEEVPVIRHVFAGRHLQAFAEGSEWWVSDRVVDATQPLNFVNSTRFGCRAGVELVMVEGQTIFVQGSGDVLRSFSYSDVEQDYTSSPVSIYASHLITDVVDVAYRRAANTTQGSQMWVVNRDGSAALIVSLRDEKVLATTPIITDGSIKAVCVDSLRQVFVVVQRSVGGQPQLCVEMLDDAAYFDASDQRTLAPASATLDGLSRLEGKTVWAMADGSPMGPFTVTGGQITLPRAASAVEVGLWPSFSIAPMPYRFVGRDGRIRVSPYRVHSAVLSLYDTTSVAIAANGGPPASLPLRSTGSGLLDVAQEDAPFTGEIRRDGLLGHQVAATVEITQLRPGRVTVRGIFTETA